jgi:Na+/H+-dicarboxylate symporter
VAKRLTWYILFALVLGLITGWAINAGVGDTTPEGKAQLEAIAGYFGIITTLSSAYQDDHRAARLATLVAGVAHMGDTAALGRVGARTMAWFITASLVSLTLGMLLVNTLEPGVGLNLPLPR